MGLREDVGSLFIVGLEGTVLSATEAAWLKLLRPSGVILFRRNIEDPSQIHALLQAASAFSTTPLFRCIDVEGGLVDRLRDLIAPTPSAAAVAFTAERKLAQRHGRLIGDELTLLGLNTTFAPVLDLALPASASVMKSRVAGPTAEQVIAYAEAFLTGLRKTGILGCGKHFPGLGGGTLDSHLAMPEIDRVWEQLWDEDQRPYRKLHRKLPFIMISHAAYPRIAESQGPASLSKYWISDVLKKKIGYRGLVLSDDMEMGGVLSGSSIEEASVAAIEAGTHLLEVCKEPALILRAFEAVLSEAERSSSFRRKVARAAAHVRKQKARLLKGDKPAAAATPKQIEAMRRRVETFTADLLAAQARVQQGKKREAP
jgi:beta-N-acetylhexosaminidase